MAEVEPVVSDFVLMLMIARRLPGVLCSYSVTSRRSPFDWITWPLRISVARTPMGRTGWLGSLGAGFSGEDDTRRAPGRLSRRQLRLARDVDVHVEVARRERDLEARGAHALLAQHA